MDGAWWSPGTSNPAVGRSASEVGSIPTHSRHFSPARKLRMHAGADSPTSPTSTDPAGSGMILILNPSAGKNRAGRELVHLRSHLIARGVRADVFLTRAEGDGRRIVEALDPPEGTLVVAAGGDGTVHEVGTALLERKGLVLGTIPLGSGNDYARLLGMPKDPVACLDAILGGVDRVWDVGQVGERSFLNTAGFALSSSVSWHSRRTGWLTGMARYGVATLRAWSTHRPVRMGFDGLEASGEHRVSFLEVGIGNRAGGGFLLLPRAHPADGLLDVCLMEAVPRWQIPFLLPRARNGRHLGHPRVIYEQVPSFRMRVESRTLIHVDGELAWLERGEHSVRVRPKALRVRITPERAEQFDPIAKEEE